MKMYIFIKDTVPDNMAPVVAAHASLACYLIYEKDEDMQKWRSESFKKVVCKVTELQFNQLKFNWTNKEERKSNVTTESSLNGDEVAITFCPREKYPDTFKSFKLWSPKPRQLRAI
jgi:peptidyl-tRNA hydrolase